MTRYIFVGIILLSISLIHGHFSAHEVSRTGDIPDLISFQGRLSDNIGNLVNGEVTIRFSVYGSDIGGTLLWVEDRIITVSNGLFQVNLGELTPLTESYFTAPERWLSLKIGTDTEMDPRIRIVSVPYALSALEKDPSWAGPALTTGDIGRTGNVGIGTETPTAKLEVSGGDAVIHGLTIGRGGGSLTTNTALGYQTLQGVTTGPNNTSTGYRALFNNLSGSNNTAGGFQALYQNTDSENSAIGYQALYSNTDGFDNTAIGSNSLLTNTEGHNNTAVGTNALTSNTWGVWNTGIGYNALQSQTTGSGNLAIGGNALFSNTDRSGLVAIGSNALYDNGLNASVIDHAIGNTAIGSEALRSNTNGYFNTAYGSTALFTNTTGFYNTAIGSQALNSNDTAERNTGAGYQALKSNTSRTRKTAIGSQAQCNVTPSQDNTAFGYQSLYNQAYFSLWSSTSIGYQALKNVNTGSNAYGYQTLYGDSLPDQENGGNNGIGYQALYNSGNSSSNTAIGYQALFNNETMNKNTAVGYNALYNLQGEATGEYGNGSIAIGINAAYSIGNPSNSSLTAIGYNSQQYSNYPEYTTSIGYNALRYGGDADVAIGSYALDSLNDIQNTRFNTTLGAYAGSGRSSLDECTFIGALSYPLYDNMTRNAGFGYNSRPWRTLGGQTILGNSSVVSIGGYTAWTDYRSSRQIINVREDVKGLEFIMNLRPVTYQVDVHNLAAHLLEDQRFDEDGNPYIDLPSDLDLQARNEKSDIIYTGFIAEEVEVAAQKCGYDFSGIQVPENSDDLYGITYEEFVVPLIKAVQEQQQIIESQSQQINELLDLILVLESEFE